MRSRCRIRENLEFGEIPESLGSRTDQDNEQLAGELAAAASGHRTRIILILCGLMAGLAIGSSGYYSVLVGALAVLPM